MIMVRRVIPTVAALLLAAAPCAFAQVETVALFNPSLLETPESIAIDHDNNKYVSLALTGEIRKIARRRRPVHLCDAAAGRAAAHVLRFVFRRPHRASRSTSTTTCTRISRPAIPAAAASGRSRTTDSRRRASARSHAVAAERHRPSPRLRLCRRLGDRRDLARARHRRHAEIWAAGPELAQLPNGLPGPNGLKLFEGELYVSNPSQSTVVAVRVRPDGTAGAIQDARDGRLLRRLRVRRARQPLLRDRSVQHGRAHRA